MPTNEWRKGFYPPVVYINHPHGKNHLIKTIFRGKVTLHNFKFLNLGLLYKNTNKVKKKIINQKSFFCCIFRDIFFHSENTLCFSLSPHLVYFSQYHRDNDKKRILSFFWIKKNLRMGLCLYNRNKQISIFICLKQTHLYLPQKIFSNAYHV